MKFLARLRAHWAVRFGVRTITIVIALLVAALVASVTIDLGPSVRQVSERQASKFLKRDVRFGRMSIHLLRGRILLEDFSIGGVAPGDRPFFVAKRLSVGLNWLTTFRRVPEFTITSVEMTDWHMLVERWEDHTSFPRFLPENDRPPGPRRFTTTLRYLRAWRGEFVYEDHQVPWSVTAPNIDLDITNLPKYHGNAAFHGGIVQVQNDLPMWVHFKTQFTLDGPKVHLDRIDLDTDGARTVASGEVDFAHWPEQVYHVKSAVHFQRMREIFWKDEKWTIPGEGDFAGTFRLYKGGHELSGTFASPQTGVNGYPFSRLYGSLRWTPQAFEVWDAGAGFHGGSAKFTYSIKPLGQPTRPTARFDASVSGADLASFTDAEKLEGVRFGGAATGRVLIEWPLGRFVEKKGQGTFAVSPPAGVTLMGPSLDARTARDSRREWGPFAPRQLPAHLPIGGDLTFQFDPDKVEFTGGRFNTSQTHVIFQGQTAWGSDGRIAFHVVSRDWQESDEVMSGILTAFGARTGAVAFGGRGEFDGAMTGPFRRPRVEGDFTGSDLWAWDTLWGDGTAHIIVENQYVDVKNSVMRLAGSEIRADGRFSLGYPREDGGEEMDARFRISRRDLTGLRHAFQIDEYPVTGLLSGEFHLTGAYQRPMGFGGMTIDNGTAYGESLDKMEASLRFDGTGIRLDGINIDKGGGTITGAAFVGWDSTYSFNADGRRIPVDSLALLRFPKAPLSGLAEFTAQGNGTFEMPRNDFKIRVNDLFVGEEGVGQVSGSLTLRGKELSGDLDAASPRLAITGTGRVALTPQADAELTFRFHDSSLDPYVRLFEPRLSPFTTAVASGSIRVVGELADFDHLLADATVDTVDLRLFDYALKNAAPIRISLDKLDVNVQDLQLVGDDTRLRLGGRVGLRDRRISLQASGDANLGILQGFSRDVFGSGRAELTASVDGPLDAPVFSGSASVINGRVRHLSMPNALDGINGIIRFDARGIRLDEVTARMGEGPVQFGGRIGLDGYLPGELNVTMSGRDMHLRYPEGIRSTVDADLSVRGNFRALTLGGMVTVKNAVWTRPIDPYGNIFDLVAQSTVGGGGAAATSAVVPLRLDVQISVPSTLQVNTSLLRLVASADLTLRGTYDKPVLFGRADIGRGEVSFEGRRYRVTRGSIDFTNPNRIEPFFDVEAETNVRVAGGQAYRVTVGAAGTTERMSNLKFESDPPLPTADVLALLLSDVQRNDVPELRKLRGSTQMQSDILTARATQALTSPLSTEMSKVMQQTVGLDTFQLSPSFVDPTNASRLNPTARLTIGKRISDRAFLTFSRSLNTTFNDQIIQLEFDQTDRLYWLVSRNEDQQTYAVEFRVRHAF